MKTRREFLKDGMMAAAGASLAGCATGSSARAPALAGDFAWGALLHLGCNMWRDWTPDGVYPKSREEELRMVKEGKIEFKTSRIYCNRDYMSVDWTCWRGQVDRIRQEGLNMVFIDLGEAYAYPSHPELHVKGSLSPDEMRKELARIRALGLEPIPKLNFSTGHDQWLREYHYMTSTPKYYRVVADVIRDACEVFDGPRYFHLGFDEETFAACGRRQLCVIRSGEQWWKDFLFCAGEAERNGARPMLWSDKICAGREDFFKHMPKSVLQVPWYYGKDFSEKYLTWDAKYEKSLTWDIQRNLASAILELDRAGFDMMPCTSNWECPEAAEAMVGFCRARVDPRHLKGFLTAPWADCYTEEKPKLLAGIRHFAAAKRKIYR